MYVKSKQKKTIDFIFSNGSIASFSTELAALVNKFNDIFGVVNTMLKTNIELLTSYESFLKEYIDSSNKYQIFLKYSDKLFNLIDTTYNDLNLGETINVKEDATYTLNINTKESEDLFKTSIRTRFFIVCYLTDDSMDQLSQKELQKYICRDMINNGTLDKLYKIINSIIMSTYPTKSGKKIWDLLSVTTGYTSDGYALRLLSSVIYKALPSLKPKENPIAYMISICKNEVDWLLRTNFGIKFVNSTINNVTVNENTNRIEEYEIYYRSIVKVCFEPILKKYEELANKLSSYNAYTTVVNICNPLIYKIFGINSYHISLDNNCLINLYCYDFLNDNDPDKTELLKILKAASIIDQEKRVLPEDIKAFTQSTIVSKELGKSYRFLNHANLKKIITESISVLYQYKYIDVDTDTEIEVNWFKFIEEFVDYLKKVASEDYTSFIQTQKERMYKNNVNVDKEMVQLISE